MSSRREFLKKSSATMGAVMIASSAISSPADASEDFPELSASRAVEAMKKGDIKAEAYAASLLARAERLRHLNAFRTLEPDTVLEAARDADKRRAAGQRLGLLHGLPIPVKDSVNTRSLPTSNGTAALRDFRPRDDAAVVKSLRNAGAIVMGKTNMHELSFGFTSNNESFGAVRNPYDPDRIPGGSSGGSAAAVAAGIAPLAVAEDTWASIRLPAACCGLAGLRPTYGRYPDAGIMPLTTMFDQVGPLARSVADLVLFDAVAAPGARPVTQRSLQGVRIGVSRRFFWEDLDPEVERLAQENLRRLRDAGAILVEVPVPDIVASTPDLAVTVISHQARDSIAGFLRAQHAGISFEELLEKTGRNLRGQMEALALPPHRATRDKYLAAVASIRSLRTQIGTYYKSNALDCLVFPATLCTPPRIGEEEDVQVGDKRVALITALARNMALGSCGGMPSLVLPAGLSRQGLPVAMEFVGLAGGDAALLGLGAALEQSAGAVKPPRL